MTTDRKDLKIQALIERVSALTAEYENKVADLRVALTVSEQDNEVLKQTLSDQTPDDGPEDPDETQFPTT